jgi:hypothetical protein
MPKIFIYDGNNGVPQRNTDTTPEDRFYFLLKLIHSSILLNEEKPLKIPAAKHVFKKKTS